MKRLLQICTLLILLSACQEEQKPKDVLSENRFKEVLVDVSLAEAYFTQNRINPADSAAMIQQYYDHIFALHHVSRDEFYTSMRYYLRHPEQFSESIQSALDSLSSIEASSRSSSK